MLLGVKNLWMVETVDSERLATALETACANSHRDEPLRVLVQVNTSGEESELLLLLLVVLFRLLFGYRSFSC